jgi:hypothetical protein
MDHSKKKQTTHTHYCFISNMTLRIVAKGETKPTKKEKGKTLVEMHEGLKWIEDTVERTQLNKV